MEIEVLEIRIDAHRQRRAKLSHSHSPRHLPRFLTRNRTSIPGNSPRILAIFPPLSPYVPNRDEDKLLSTLWRNRDPCAPSKYDGSRAGRGIRNWKVFRAFPNFIPFKPNSFSYRKPPKKLFPLLRRGNLLFETSFPFSGGLKNSKFTADLAKNFGKLEIFESRKLGHLGGCLLSLEEFSSENIFV